MSPPSSLNCRTELIHHSSTLKSFHADHLISLQKSDSEVKIYWLISFDIFLYLNDDFTPTYIIKQSLDEDHCVCKDGCVLIFSCIFDSFFPFV